MPRDPVPSLRDLDPRAVALDACTALVGRLAKMAFMLHPRALDLPRPEELVDGSDLGLTVQTLTAFAQRGCPVGDWVDSEDGADALLTVVSALYGGALDHESATPGILREGEPTTPLETVLLAAWTRVQLGRGEPVEPRQIALLTGETTRTVQFRIADGTLPASGGKPARVPAEAAVGYLRDRGVKGVG